MNKEKLKKVFSFIGKLFLLIILTYSAVASTIGCFNSLKKNIDDTPNKVQEVKRANINVSNIYDNIFTGLVPHSDVWSFRRVWTYSNYGYMLVGTERGVGAVTDSIFTLNESYLVNVRVYRSQYSITDIYVTDDLSDVSTSIYSGRLPSSTYNDFSFIYTPTNNDFLGIYFVGPDSYGSSTIWYVDFYIIPYFDSSSAYDSGYSTGYSEGYDIGNSEGFDNGYVAGEGYVLSHPHDFDLYPQEEYDSAYYDGYNVGVMESYDVGYNAGYGAGATDVVNRELAENGFIKLANIVFNAPYNILHNTFNFEFLGINLWALMSFVFTIALVFGVIGFLKRR